MNIENYDPNTVLSGSSDADSINNGGDNVSIDTGEGDDSIETGASQVTIDAGAGNDYILSAGMNASLNGGDGDDQFEMGGWDATIKGGAGNDSIHFNGRYDRHIIEYAEGDGDDTIDGVSFSPTGVWIKITEGSVDSYEQVGNDFILHIGSGSLTLKNAAGCKVFDANDNSTILGYSYIDNNKSGQNVTGTSNNDWIYNEGRTSTLNGGDGNDMLENNGATRSVVNGGAGNDKIYNHESSRTTLNGGEGDDVIVNLWNHTGVLMNGDAGNDIIENWFDGSNSTINGGDGDDSIYNNGASVSAIDGGKGNDYIETGIGDNITVTGGAGDDSIMSDSTNGIIKGGAGNDSININSGANVLVTGGDGDDQIETNAETATIRAGKGADYINLRHNDGAGSNVIQYSKDDGFDYISGFNENDTFYIIDGSSYSTMSEGSNVIIEVNGNEVILENAADKTINIVSSNLGIEDDSDTDVEIEYNEIVNAEDDKKINGTSNPDYIKNTGENVTIQANGGNDIIDGSDEFADLFVFSANDGNNTITNFSGEDSLQIISGTISSLVSGDDLIISATGSKNTARITLKGIGNKTVALNNSVLTLNEGKEIFSDKDDDKLVGGNGDDYIESTHQNVTINGGKGNDTIVGSDYGELIQFGANDGNDLVTNFGKNDTLQITSGTLSTVKSGDDLIVTVKNATAESVITLSGAGAFNVKSDGEFLTVDDVNYIDNTRDNRKVSGTTGKDYITNSGENVSIQAGGDNDTIDGSSFGEVFMFSYASGDDVITNFDKNDTLRATAGTISAVETIDNDVVVSIKKSGQSAVGKITLQGAADLNFIKTSTALTVDQTNYIDNDQDKIKVSGTTGKDYITNSAENVTIQAGGDNDTIEGSDLYGETFLFSYASGDDVINNFGKGDTLKATAGTISNVETVDNDVVVTIKKSGKTDVGTVTLKDAANLIIKQTSTALTVENINVINNQTDKKKVSGTTGKDYVTNTAEHVTIQAGGDDDTIDGSDLYGEQFWFSYASGDDVITNFDKNDTLKATSGTISAVDTVDNDVVVTITKKGQSAVGKITLQGAADLNFIRTSTALTVSQINYINNDQDKIKVSGTTGKDYITNDGEHVTIQAGGDNDTIDGSSFGEVFMMSYASGDDVISNFGVNDTLKCTSGTITNIETVDNDVLITMTKGKTSGTVLLKDAATYSFKKSGQTLTVETVNQIRNTEDNKRVVGTGSKDYIENTGEDVTIVGSAGIDTITGSDTFGELYQFTSLNGGNVITNFGTADTLQVTRGSIYSTVLSEDGNDLIIALGAASTAGTVTLQGAGAYVDLIKKSGKYLIFDDVQLLVNQTDNKKVSGKSNQRSYIINTGENATLSGGGSANDTLEGTDGTKEVYLFAASSGEDLITNFGKEDTLYISSGSIADVERSGNDYIVNVSNGKTNGTVTLGGAGIYDFEQDGKKLTVKDINYIYNQTDNRKVSGTTKADFITNDASNVTIQAGGGNDTLYGSNQGEMMLFSYASGDDVILNFDKDDTLQSTSGTISAVDTDGDDVVVSIKKKGQKAVGTVTLKNANKPEYIFKQANSTTLIIDAINPIENDKDDVKVAGTNGRDYITNTGENVTVQAGAENDTIVGSDLYGDIYLFSYASGDDVITNFAANDTLKSTSGTLTYKTVGDDAVVTITKSKKSGTITLVGAGGYDFVNENNTLTVKQIVPIENDKDNVKISGTANDDYIINTGENVTIQAGGGNDTIDGSIFGEIFQFSYASGDDIITNFGANDTLMSTSGTLSYKQSGDDIIVTITKSKKSGNITLQGAAQYADLIKKTNSALYVDGLNIIENADDKKKISGTSGRDYIANTGEHVTIQAGAGDDIIEGSDMFGERFQFSYASGDDTITNFGLGDTLQATAGTLSYKQDGNDYIVSIKKSGKTDVGTVTLKDAATDYTLTKSGSNYIATAKSTSAQLPSDDYWFLDESSTTESPLSAIVEHESAVDLPTNFNDVFKQSTVELTTNARHRQKQSAK